MSRSAHRHRSFQIKDVPKWGVNLNILTAEKISKSYSEKILLDEVTLGIDEGDKICLIGVNGTGKSTLLKILAGLEFPDTGTVTSGSNLKIEYLPQTPVFDRDITVLDYLFNTDSPLMTLIREYERALEATLQRPDDSEASKKLIGLSQRMDAAGAWSIESEAKSILTQLNIYNFNESVLTLSGGQKKRVAMAAALIHPAGLLILDEPTNHVDNDTVDWLEQYLKRRHGALLMVTHDRYFLERVANRILELDHGRLFSYAANYSEYLERKLEREENAASTDEKRRNLLRKELKWMHRGAKARSTKQKARIDRFEKLSEEKNTVPDGSIEIKVASSRLGKRIIEIEHLNKSYGTRKLIDDFSYQLPRGGRIGIVGPNGSGKTTLLNIIAGRIPADGGIIRVGETVRIGYFSQDSAEMDNNLRVIEYMRSIAEYVTTDEGSMSASQMLERFLFPPDMQWTPISKLSGGEKRRLFLLSVLIAAPNVLLLDEPTNDLDIQTLTILEDYLDAFPGAVIAVSHDRYFLDRVVNTILFYENGRIRQFNGAYSDNVAEFGMSAPPASPAKKENEVPKRGRNERPSKKPLKLTFNEQRELDEIDGRVASLEEELEQCENELQNAASDYAALQELLLKQKSLEHDLEIAMERWVYLNELKEKIDQEASDKK